MGCGAGYPITYQDDITLIADLPLAAVRGRPSDTRISSAGPTVSRPPYSYRRRVLDEGVAVGHQVRGGARGEEGPHRVPVIAGHDR